MSSLPTTTACPQKYQSPILPREPVPKKPATSPRTTPSGSGTGPKQALEAITPPLRAQRENSTSTPSFPARAEPVPRSTPTITPTDPKQPVPNLQSSHRSLSPKSQQHHPGHHQAAAGPGRSKHRKRSPLPFAHSAKSPYLPRASLRAQDRSRGARPRARPRPCPHQFPNPQNQNKHLRHQLPCVTKYI
jgi:hypothetical protein